MATPSVVVSEMSTASALLESTTFQEVRNQLEARMISLGLDIESPESWNEPIGDVGVDELFKDVCNSTRGAIFLRQLEDYTVSKMSEIGNTLPGVIDLDTAFKPDIVMTLVEMERLYKLLQERMDVLESNRGQLRMALGKIMRETNESEFKASDGLGRPVANIKLDMKLRPAWPEKEYQFDFFEKVGQADIIQPAVPWQTAEKVMNSFVDDADNVVRMSNEPTVDEFIELRAAQSKRTGIPVDDIKHAIWNPTTGGVRISEYMADDEFPFRVVCNLFQTVVAKVTKIY